VEYDASGKPKVQGSEDVCFSLTLPETTMPENGWPVVIYAHGTGGNYRSHVSEGISSELSAVALDDGTEVDFAVVGIDQVLHGTRAQADVADPGPLVYNFGNPRAARGNFLQAAADNFTLVSLLKSWSVDAGESPTGEAFKFDPARIVFIGHSQGGTSGALALPREPDVGAAVLSGTGGGLALSLIYKTSPVEVKAGVEIAIQEDGVGSGHPVLNLVQMYFGPVDPLVHATLLFYEPLPEVGPINVLHTYGLDDSYTPPQTIEELASAMRTTLATPGPGQEVLDKIDGVNEKDPPFDWSWVVGDEKVLGVTAEYAPSGYDGHFVLTHHETAIRQYTTFLGTYVRDGRPTLVP
jgi:pimeloyl-ACP methyl ester carboxylesterase